jgi:beta-N-acetylhexosaminidase
MIFISYITFLFLSIPLFAKSNSKIEDIIKGLSLEQKIGQLFVVAANASFSEPLEPLASAMVKPYGITNKGHIETLIKQYHIGGICWIGKSTPQEQLKLTQYYNSISQIPLFFMQDCEWGLSLRLKNTTIFPKAAYLAQLKNRSLIYDIAQEIGFQCKKMGIHMNLAPVVDVNSNPDNPVIGVRSFSRDPIEVVACARKFIKGSHEAGILSCIKHFPGHGDTSIDSHLDLPVINHTRARLDNIELFPFRELIQDDVDAVMSAHLLVKNLDARCPVTFSKTIITDFLRNDLGFKGLIITDALGMHALTNYYKPGNIEVKALQAGHDILLCPVDVAKASALIYEAVKKGDLTEQEIDEHISRILHAKKKVGALS